MTVSNSRNLCFAMIGVVALAWGCDDGPKPAPKEPVPQAEAPQSPEPEPTRKADVVPTSPEVIAKNNRAVGLMGQFKYGEARDVLKELVDEFPDWLDAKVNLAIVALNQEQGGGAALPLLAEVLKIQPDHVRANYCSGLLLYHAGRRTEALSYLQKAMAADPDDAYTAYLLAQCFEEESIEQAVEWYRKAINIDPYFRAGYYRLFLLSRQSGGKSTTSETAQQFLKTFQELGKDPRARVFEFKYTRMGPKAELSSFESAEAGHADLPTGTLFETPVPLIADAEFSCKPLKESKGTSLTVCDTDGDGRVDLLFLAGVSLAEGGSANAVFAVRDDNLLELNSEHPLAKVPDVQAALWGDYDNDSLADVYFCRTGKNQLWRQKAAGEWEDVTESTKTAGADLNTVDGAFFDADHDGDLDLFLVNAEGPNELLNNNRDGTFAAIAAEAKIAGDSASVDVQPVDLDGDRDLDLIVLNRKPPHEVYLNERTGTYSRDEGLAEFAESAIAGAVTADVNSDGRAEIYCVGPEGLCRWDRSDPDGWRKTILNAQAKVAPDEIVRLAVTDVTGDGRLELIVGRDSWQVFRVDAEKAESIGSCENKDLAGWSVAVLDGERGPSLLGMPTKGTPLIWRPGSGRHPFLALSLTGKAQGVSQIRSNASGLGSRLEVRVGLHWSVIDYLRNGSGPGQSLQPAALGLGGEKKADFVRIAWPDGVSQSELQVASGWKRIEEMDRMPSSCPILFAWNGDRYEFLGDLLSMGGIGYFVSPGESAPSDPTENFVLPESAPVARDGVFHLKLGEPMEEMTYLDSAALVSYDLPPGWSMVLDERLGTSEPLPTGEPRFYRRSLQPIAAENNRGEDVTETVQHADYLAAPPGPLDERFIGRLRGEHELRLTFAEPLDKGPGRPLLVANGWIEFPFSQTVYAAWQAGATFDPPTLEARTADGRWQIVHERFGYPAGTPRGMSLPLNDLPAGTKELRIRTNMEIYWDRIAIAYVEPCPQVRRVEIPLVGARLQEAGFIPRVFHAQHRPTLSYEDRIPLADTRDPAGFYTEFGPVEELLHEADGALAIIGPGEEVHLEFKAPADDPPNRWSRRFVLEVAGWCKDADLYTQDSETVGPLPVAEKPSDHRDSLHHRYNTRYQTGR